MAQAVRYRTGIDRTTGQPLVGWAHVQQSLAVIWTTRFEERVMLLPFGSNLRSWLAEDLSPATALGIYGDLIAAAHRWEPEYRVATLQFVLANREGALGLRHGGVYYPEGRFGNYERGIPVGAGSPIVIREQLARRVA